MKLPIAIIFGTLPTFALVEYAVCTNACSVSIVEFSKRAPNPLIPFQFTGTISYARQAHDAKMRTLAVSDPSGNAILTCANGIRDANRLEPGTTADFAGVIGRTAAITSVCIRAVNPPPTPIQTNIDDLLDGLYDCRLSSFTGMLRGLYESETAARWLILVVYGENNRIFISVPALKGTKERLHKLIGSRITATGVCVPQDTSRRRQTGRTFKVANESSISECPGETSAKPPDVSNIRLTRPSRVFSLGRHSATGRVMAVWQKRNVLIRRDDGDIVGLVLSGDRPPPINENILAVGLPESDLFRINLTDATWRNMPGEPTPLPLARPVSAHEISLKKQGFQLFMARYHGQAITLRGIVRSLSRDAEHMIHIDCDGILVPVDASSVPECLGNVEIGCELSVSGTCVMTEENRNGNAALPQMNGFIIVLRQPGDLVITDRPPWWTPSRMFAAIVALFATLLAILAWNVALRRAASRKGQALLKEQLGHVKAELKTEERTRLAVELHDSLAQNLTGVSLEIDTAAKLSGDNASDAMRKHLATASSALKSCRDELRNCLWDLRNRALEAKTMDEAIRQTLAPHIIGRDVSIRFNVPRSRISDSTAHAILRIIRELTLNGIRHGAATRIQIAGCIDGNRLSFSVRDNGSGFDPETAPGFFDGHYGLLGIRERIDELEGSFSLHSATGCGTKASISLQMPQDASEAQRKDGT